MMQPTLLLCDEPTSGLDIATTMDVANLLKTVRNMNVTIIVSSHDLDFLMNISDQIILLKNGELTANINPKLLQP